MGKTKDFLHAFNGPGPPFLTGDSSTWWQSSVCQLTSIQMPSRFPKCKMPAARHKNDNMNLQILGTLCTQGCDTTHCRGGMGIDNMNLQHIGHTVHLTQHIAGCDPRQAWASSPHTAHCRGGMGIASSHNTLQGRHGHRLLTQHIAGEAWASSPHTKAAALNRMQGRPRCPRFCRKIQVCRGGWFYGKRDGDYLLPPDFRMAHF